MEGLVGLGARGRMQSYLGWFPEGSVWKSKGNCQSPAEMPRWPGERAGGDPSSRGQVCGAVGRLAGMSWPPAGLGACAASCWPSCLRQAAVPGPSIREDREQVCEGEAPCRALPPGGGPGRVVLPWEHGPWCTHSVRYLRAGCPLDDHVGSLGLQGGELKILVVSGTWCWRLWPRLGSGARLLGRALRPGCPPWLPLVSCRPFS